MVSTIRPPCTRPFQTKRTRSNRHCLPRGWITGYVSLGVRIRLLIVFAEWTAAYPSRELDIASLPSAWIDALDHAVAQGRIPDIPPSVMIDDTPTYPGGLDPMSDFVCSTTPKCNSNPDVWWDAPAGIWATSFDDGPLPVRSSLVMTCLKLSTLLVQASDRLFEFLDENEEHATHFFIGVHIREYPERFLTAFETLGGMHIVYPKGLSIIYTHEILVDDIAVHTWTHPHMTTLSNLEILGELGWTMEIIHNSTGGLVPAYWRPPFGDSDNRVNAIAKEVFGLTTVIWNREYVFFSSLYLRNFLTRWVTRL